MTYGIVGCGKIGTAHARAIRANPDVEQLVVTDADARRAELLAQEVDASVVHSVAALADAVSAASVCTPPAQHYEVAQELLEAGVAVFCEKPLSMTEGEAAQLVQISRRRPIPLTVGFKMRYGTIFQRAAAELPRIGSLRAVTTAKAQPLTADPAKRAWVRTVGAMYELSVHEFDLVSMLTGQVPLVVRASVLDQPEPWTRERGFSIMVEYSRGLIGQFTCHYSDAMTFQYRDLTMQFVGENGYLRLERPDRIVVHTDTVEVIDVAEEGDTFGAELSDFLGAVQGKTGGLLSRDGTEGFVATALVEAAYRAGRDRTAARIAQLDDYGGMNA
jgi:predicted dehydrogenase